MRALVVPLVLVGAAAGGVGLAAAAAAATTATGGPGGEKKTRSTSTASGRSAAETGRLRPGAHGGEPLRWSGNERRRWGKTRSGLSRGLGT
ncbi:hypothetical protein Esi_0563_0009 [Ectocarpus siliculosus]|uniref:Secreted protein n=1 Tax=Ectocarpus siliculosus TaxID=2880 RepID=D7G4F7_ECTSI|nr:hypothetical protein Esi_0563_0009 [Ectocarpus siliculosus]|eukprot:CBJ33703.1 hypothetical protein Esi_0563_0009 [Ectocarpus siliculosus]